MKKYFRLLSTKPFTWTLEKLATKILKLWWKRLKSLSRKLWVQKIMSRWYLKLNLMASENFWLEKFMPSIVSWINSSQSIRRQMIILLSRNGRRGCLVSLSSNSRKWRFKRKFWVILKRRKLSQWVKQAHFLQIVRQQQQQTLNQHRLIVKKMKRNKLLNNKSNRKLKSQKMSNLKSYLTMRWVLPWW